MSLQYIYSPHFRTCPINLVRVFELIKNSTDWLSWFRRKYNIIRCPMVSEDLRPQMTSGQHWIVVRLYIPRFRHRRHALHNRARLLCTERKIEIAATVAKICVLPVRHYTNIQTSVFFHCSLRVPTNIFGPIQSGFLSFYSAKWHMRVPTAQIFNNT